VGMRSCTHNIILCARIVSSQPPLKTNSLPIASIFFGFFTPFCSLCLLPTME
jgi:hypothetical protein